jgi:membrane protease YdiL (CAAX protease family)
MLAGASSIALGFFFFAFIFVGLSIYLALVWQISARRTIANQEIAGPPPKMFGLPEAGVACLVSAFFLWMIIRSASGARSQVTTSVVVAGELLFITIVLIVLAFLNIRGFDIDALAGFSKSSLRRALSTGIVLLLAAWPLIALADWITQNALSSGSSKQEIVDLFNSSRTIGQRILIIVLAVVVAPIAEEFIFRFFIYGVFRRYFGIGVGLVFNSLLFAAAHAHLPSAAPLFVLGACFTLAYQWSGSILVSMSMHALFNSIQLILLAFPELFQQ